MKTFARFLATATLAAAVALPVSRLDAQETANAKELAARLSSNITDGSAFIRVRMKTGGTTLQVQIKERRTRNSSDILYQVLYPKERKGEAVLLQKSGGKATGKVFTPAGGVQNISSMKESMLGTALSYEDVIENFFAWGDQSIAGAEEVKNVKCQILESKSSGGSSYSRVRSWIDTRKMIPLRVEKFSGANLVRRIETTRVAEDDTDRRVPASLTVQYQNQVTEVEGSSSKSDVTYTDSDFSPQGMQSLTPPSSK